MTDPLRPDALRLVEAQLPHAAVGAEVRVAHRLDVAFFGAPAGPRIVAASLRRPLTTLAAETWHVAVAGASLLVVGTLLGNVTVQRMGPPWSTLYVRAVLGWAALNGAELARYFPGRRDQRAIDGILAEASAIPTSRADADVVEA